MQAYDILIKCGRRPHECRARQHYDHVCCVANPTTLQVLATAMLASPRHGTAVSKFTQLTLARVQKLQRGLCLFTTLDSDAQAQSQRGAASDLLVRDASTGVVPPLCRRSDRVWCALRFCRCVCRRVPVASRTAALELESCLGDDMVGERMP